jgi:hypothetical protein
MPAHCLCMLSKFFGKLLDRSFECEAVDNGGAAATDSKYWFFGILQLLHKGGILSPKFSDFLRKLRINDGGHFGRLQCEHLVAVLVFA